MSISSISENSEDIDFSRCNDSIAAKKMYIEALSRRAFAHHTARTRLEAAFDRDITLLRAAYHSHLQAKCEQKELRYLGPHGQDINSASTAVATGVATSSLSVLSAAFKHCHLSLNHELLSAAGVTCAHDMLCMSLLQLTLRLRLTIGQCVHLKCTLSEAQAGRPLPSLKVSSRPGRLTERWSVEQVCMWLTRMNCARPFVHLFSTQDITGLTLLNLQSAHMMQIMGLPVDVAVHIALAIQKLRGKIGLPPSETRNSLRAVESGQVPS